jgi:hypothetical protein
MTLFRKIFSSVCCGCRPASKISSNFAAFHAPRTCSTSLLKFMISSPNEITLGDLLGSAPCGLLRTPLSCLSSRNSSTPSYRCSRLTPRNYILSKKIHSVLGVIHGCQFSHSHLVASRWGHPLFMRKSPDSTHQNMLRS